jgi:hypothetical protein
MANGKTSAKVERALNLGITIKRKTSGEKIRQWCKNSPQLIILDLIKIRQTKCFV